MASGLGGGGRRPLTREQIARRMVSREEVAKWTAESNREEVVYLHYWESKEVMPLSEPGDEYLVFVGRSEVLTARIWTFLDHTQAHNAFILRNRDGVKDQLSDKDGIMLRFQLHGELRIFNKEGLRAVIDEEEMHVYQRGDDVIIRVVR